MLYNLIFTKLTIEQARYSHWDANYRFLKNMTDEELVEFCSAFGFPAEKANQRNMLNILGSFNRWRDPEWAERLDSWFK